MKDNIFECSIPKGKGVIAILGGSGDTKIFWNKKNEDEVENARQTFDKLVKEKKFAAFSVSKMGRRSKKVIEFDPNIQKLILIPPMAGGAFIGGDSYANTECRTLQMGELVPAKEAHKIDETAEIKGMTLLKKKIGDESFIKLVALGYLEVKGKYGIYKISQNGVELSKDDIIGKKRRPLCYHLCIDIPKDKGYLPQGDRFLSLYILIKESENKFIEIANFRSVYTKDEFQERNQELGRR